MVLAIFTETHLVLALIIVFLLFGGKKLPELARGLGEAMKEFKKAQREMNEETPVNRPVAQPPAAATTPTVVTPAPNPDPHKPA